MARGSHDTVGRLGAIRVPMLVMVGGDDRVSRGGSDHVESARALAAAIADAQLVEIPGARHLFPWEAAEQTNRLLLEFFARHSAQAASSVERCASG
jgi:pimeloyl-ACP methyl ester carboxylesterase